MDKENAQRLSPVEMMASTSCSEANDAMLLATFIWDRFPSRPQSPTAINVAFDDSLAVREIGSSRERMTKTGADSIGVDRDELYGYVLTRGLLCQFGILAHV